MTAAPAPPAPGLAPAGWRAALLAVLVAAAAIRVLAAAGDLWLDEIWAIALRETVSSPVDVFARLRTSANHPLLTFYFLALPEAPPFAVYRLPSVLAGIGTVALAAHVARRWGRLEALLAAVLTGSSHLLVHYSSEARGYALMTFFALLCFELAGRFHRRPRPVLAAAFAGSAILGALSHLVFLLSYAALGLWSTAVLLAPRGGRARGAARLALLHGPVLLFLAALYAGFARDLTSPGGPPASILANAELAVTITLSGAQLVGPFGAALCAGAALAAGAGLALLARRRDGDAVFYGLQLFAVPAAFLAIARPEHFYVRYLTANAAFLLLLLSLVLARGLRGRGPLRAVAALALLGVVGANAAGAANLLGEGRGQYTRALRYMVDHSEGGRVTVSPSQDLPTGLVLAFYGRLVPDAEIVYVPAQAPAPVPEWLVVGSYRSREPRTRALLSRGARYRLAASFPFSALTGSHWFVYRKDPAQ